MVVTMIWKWSRFEVRCSDGPRFVYRNVDYVFPLYFKDVKRSAAAALQGLKKIRAKVSSRYESDIRGILFTIDEKNRSIQAHFRAAYVVYACAPCKNLEYLEKAVEEIRQDERDLRAAEAMTDKFIELLSSHEIHKVSSDLLNAHFAKITAILNYRTPAAALAEKMSHVSRNAEEWRAQ